MKKTIIIRPITANLKHNTDILGRMDPYVRVTLEGEKKESSVAFHCGKTPSWDDQISFYYHDEDILTIEVWDNDTFTRDDLIGRGSLAISTIQKGGDKFYDWIPLTYKGKDAGKLLLDIQFLHESPHNFGNPKFYPQQTYQQHHQSVYHQQNIPQQGTIQQPLTKQVTHAPTVDQMGIGDVQRQQEQIYPGQFIPSQKAQQGNYPHNGGMMQQQEHPSGNYQQGSYPY